MAAGTQKGIIGKDGKPQGSRKSTHAPDMTAKSMEQLDMTIASLTPSQKAYEAWLGEWGHVDFSLLQFLPVIKTNS